MALTGLFTVAVDAVSMKWPIVYVCKVLMLRPIMREWRRKIVAQCRTVSLRIKSISWSPLWLSVWGSISRMYALWCITISLKVSKPIIRKRAERAVMGLMPRHLCCLILPILAGCDIWLNSLSPDRSSKSNSINSIPWRRLLRRKPAVAKCCCITLMRAH